MLIVLIIIIIIIILYLININRYENFCPEKYDLCIMAIFKNEELYLEEWIKHHINQGINHFYLYSNDVHMNKYPYLYKYLEYITIIPWTDKINNKDDTVQRQAYTHCIQNYNNEYKYIMMLDIDEFIVSQDKNYRVSDIVSTLNGPNTKAIKVQRYDFGSNNHIFKPDGNVMDNYKKREKVCSSYKTIANSDYIDTTQKFYGVHDFPFNDNPGKVYNDYFGYFNHKKMGYPNSCQESSINEVPLVINHYYTKSYYEYLKRCELWKDGGVNTVGYRKDCAQLFEKKNKNEVDA